MSNRKFAINPRAQMTAREIVRQIEDIGGRVHLNHGIVTIDYPRNLSIRYLLDQGENVIGDLRCLLGDPPSMSAQHRRAIG